MPKVGSDGADRERTLQSIAEPSGGASLRCAIVGVAVRGMKQTRHDFGCVRTPKEPPMSPPMSWQKNLLAISAVAVVAATFAPSEASARHRNRGHHWAVPAAAYCGGQLPAWGKDACGLPEFSYGDGCWKRVIVNTPEGPRSRRVRTCGPDVL